MLEVALIREDPWPDTLDWEALATRAATAAIAATPQGEWLQRDTLIEVAVRLTSDSEARILNREYRQKNYATNVLSFPMIQPDLLDTVTLNSDDGEVLLGDIVLAHGVCAKGSGRKGIRVEDHATHLIVHGVLHLLGHDHGGDAEAEAMEGLERDVLAGLGIANPYIHDED